MLKLKSYEIESYLREKGLTFRRRGQKAECKICLFCSGGDHSDAYTFVVYLDETGGNFKCMRGSCARGFVLAISGTVQPPFVIPIEWREICYSPSLI